MALKNQQHDVLRQEVIQLAQAGYQLTTKQAAIYLGLSERTLETYRDIGKLPRFVKIGQHIRYPMQFLDEFLRSNTPTPSIAGNAELHENEELG